MLVLYFGSAAMALCPSVSVTSQCSVEAGRWIELVFGMKA